MNKTIFVILCLCLTILLCSCANSGEESELKVEVISEYIPLLYERSVGGDTDTHTAEYSGEKFFSREEYKKSITEERIVEEFGSTRQLDYDLTWKYDDLSYEIDRYCYVKGFDSVFAQYRTDTNKIVWYDTSDMPNRDYKSPVNPDSTKEEYIEYVKDIFNDVAGVSIDGWKMTIGTCYGKNKWESGFVNYSDDTENDVVYSFYFTKYISGVKRYDTMEIKMTNVGEVIYMDAINSDDAMAPFEDVKIDGEKAKQLVLDAFSNSGIYHNGKPEIAKFYLVAQDNSLYVVFQIKYNVNIEYGVKAGLTYAVEVARIEE